MPGSRSAMSAPRQPSGATDPLRPVSSQPRPRTGRVKPAPYPRGRLFFINRVAGRFRRPARDRRRNAASCAHNAPRCPGCAPPCRRRGADHLARRADDQRIVGEFLALGDQRAGADQAVGTDLRPVQYGGAHADQAVRPDGAAVQHRLVADGAAGADGHRISGIGVQYAQLLDVHARRDRSAHCRRGSRCRTRCSPRRRAAPCRSPWHRAQSSIARRSGIPAHDRRADRSACRPQSSRSVSRMAIWKL